LFQHENFAKLSARFTTRHSTSCYTKHLGRPAHRQTERSVIKNSCSKNSAHLRTAAASSPSATPTTVRRNDIAAYIIDATSITPTSVRSIANSGVLARHGRARRRLRFTTHCTRDGSEDRGDLCARPPADAKAVNAIEQGAVNEFSPAQTPISGGASSIVEWSSSGFSKAWGEVNSANGIKQRRNGDSKMRRVN